MLEIIRNRQSDYCIAISASASIVEQTVSGELAEYLQKVYGVDMPIVSENMVVGNAIYVGHTQYAKTNNFAGDSLENWLIAVSGSNVVLTGGLSSSDRGVAYSVYHFLEDIVGIRWWTWFEEYIPEADSLSMPADYYRSATPFFEYRNSIDTFQPVDYAYIPRNRMNAWSDVTDVSKIAHKDFTSRGGIKYFGLPHPSHTIPRMIPPEEYYDEHPEWFSYNKLLGTRPKPSQHAALYCQTNEGLIRFTADKVIENIEKNAELARKYGVEMPSFFSVSIADASGHCECEMCERVHEKSGRSGYNLHFVNAVARLVKEKYPDVKIITLVYFNYIDPPKDDMVPDDNVIIHYADLKVDLLRDVFADTNKVGLKTLDDWSAKCARNKVPLYMWDYYLQEYPNCMMPYFLKLGTNFRYFYEKGAKGCFIEHEVSHMSDFFTMTQWLLARVMEDPYQDYDSLMDDFVTRYYGAAASYIWQYIDLLKENLADNGCRIMVFEQCMMSNYVSYKMVRDGLKVLLEAEASVKDDPTRLDRVRLVLSCLYRTIAMRYGEFAEIAERQGESMAISKETALALSVEYTEINKRLYAKPEEYPEHSKSVISWVDTINRQTAQFVEKVRPEIELPQELQQYGKKNVYVVNATDFYGLAGCGMQPDGHQVGESYHWEEELSREVLRLDMQEMPVGRRVKFMASTKEDPLRNPLEFFTEGDSDNVMLELFREDLYQNQYHLYHVGDVSGVTPYTSSMFRLFWYLGYCVGLSNLYEIFPADTYGIYVNFKVTGQGFGGSKDQPDIIYLDTVYIVKKA